MGALFVLFSHLVDQAHPLHDFWHRPLTFSAYGIDSISCSDENDLVGSLEYLEYKHTFSTDVEFNHPFSITKVIVCWDFVDPAIGDSVADSYDYIGSIQSFIEHAGKRIGFRIGDIRLKSGLHAIGNQIAVLGLKRLLANTFRISERKPVAAAKKK